jgi:hypothetical protein
MGGKFKPARDKKQTMISTNWFLKPVTVCPSIGFQDCGLMPAADFALTVKSL